MRTPHPCWSEEHRYPQACSVLSHSVMANSLPPCGLWPTRLVCAQGFSRQGYWSGFPCPPPRDLPNPGIKPRSPASQAGSLPSESPKKQAAAETCNRGELVQDPSGRGKMDRCKSWCWIMITLYAKQKKRHRCTEQTFGLCGRRWGWDVSREQHRNMHII